MNYKRQKLNFINKHITTLSLFIIGFLSNAAVAAGASVVPTGGFRIGETSDPYWMQFNGLVKFDETFFSGKDKDKGTDFRSGANLRSLGLDFSGGLGRPDLSYMFGLSMESDRGVKFEDAYITYSGFKTPKLSVSVGLVYPGFCLENTASSKWVPFLERSMPTEAFSPCVGLGVSLNKWSDNYSINAAISHPKQGDGAKNQSTTSSINTDKSDLWQVSARGTYALLANLEENKIFQLGFAVHYKDDGNNWIEFSSRPEARARNTTKVVNTSYNNLRNIKSRHHYMLDAEISGQNGPLYMDAEYQYAHVKRSDGLDNLKFSGYHAEAAYVLTGEARKFKTTNGTFGQIIPNSDSGAWEVAARYSFLNLNDKDVRGGSSHNIALALNWYLDKHIRVSTNYVLSKMKERQTLNNRKLNTLAFRLQLVF